MQIVNSLLAVMVVAGSVSPSLFYISELIGRHINNRTIADEGFAGRVESIITRVISADL